MSAGRSAARALFPVVALLLGVLVPWLLAEGARAVLGGPQAETSLAYTLYAKAFRDLRTADEDPVDATTRMIADAREIERMLPAMKAAGLVLGNSPFSGLKSDAASMNADFGDCRAQKPNLRRVVGFLRSNLFNPFDQVTFQYEADRVLPAELDEFLKRYAFRRVLHTSNEHGERRTLPLVDAPRKVLVAGDSIALGAMLDDGETLSSQLQARDRSRQFVNLGIAGVKAADVACALERAAGRYRGGIDELVYVLCENDWMPSEKNGNPDDLIDWIDAFRSREAIGEVTLLYMPYLYNTAPELTRLRGHMLSGYPTWHDEKRRVLERARAAGFRTIDYLEVTDAERDRTGTQFATMALYVDHIHPSRTGVERLVSRMTEAPGGGALRRNAARAAP